MIFFCPCIGQSILSISPRFSLILLSSNPTNQPKSVLAQSYNEAVFRFRSQPLLPHPLFYLSCCLLPFFPAVHNARLLPNQLLGLATCTPKFFSLPYIWFLLYLSSAFLPTHNFLRISRNDRNELPNHNDGKFFVSWESWSAVPESGGWGMSPFLLAP